MADIESGKDRQKEDEPGVEKSGSTKVVVLPVFSTKVLAGFESDEIMSRIKNTKRKKRRNRKQPGK